MLRPTRRFFGHDVFVSYSRHDAKGYPDALVAALPRQISVDSDKFDSEPGSSTPQRVLRRVRRANMLIVIASPAGADSTGIADEIRTFLPTRRNILVIDVDGTVARCRWRELVEGLPAEDETLERLENAEVSPLVVRRIVNMVGYFTRARRLEWSAAAAGILFVASLLGLLWVRSTTAGARSDALLAEADRGAATVEAVRQRKNAEQQKAIAEDQQLTASAQRIANSAMQIWNERSVSIDTALLVAAESLRRRQTAEAFAVMHAALPLRPTRVGAPHPVVRREGVSVSPDGRWFGTLDYSIVEARTGRTIWREPDSDLIDTPYFGDQFAAAICRRGKTIVHLFDGPRLERHRRFSQSDWPISIFFSTPSFYFAFEPTAQNGMVQVRRREDNEIVEIWPASDATAAGNVLAIATDGQHVQLRDASSLQPIGPALQFPGPINRLAMSEDSSTLAVIWWKPGDLAVPTGGVQFNGQVSLYCLSPVAVPTGQIAFGQMVDDVALSHDGSAMAVLTGAGFWGPNFGVITLCEPRPWRRVWSRNVTTSALSATKPNFVGDDVMFIDGRVVRIAERETGFDKMMIISDGGIDQVAVARNKIVTLGPSGVTSWRVPVSAARARDERVLALALEGRLVVFRGDQGVRVRSTHPPRDLLRTAIPSPDSEFGEWISPLSFPLRDRRGRRIEPVSMDRRGRRIAMAFPSRARIYDIATALPLPDRWHFDPALTLTAMQMSPSGERLVTAVSPSTPLSDDDPTIRLTEVPSGRRIDQFDILPQTQEERFLRTDWAVTSIAMSADGSRIVGTSANTAWIREVTTKRTVRLGPVCPGAPCIVAISPAGDMAAVAGGDKVILFPTGSPSKCAQLDVLLPIVGLGFSEDGGMLAIIASRESQSRLVVASVKTDSSPLFLDLPYVPAAVTFSTDAARLAVVDRDGIVHDIILEARAAATEICNRIGRSLTHDEWDRYVRESPYVDTCVAIREHAHETPSVTSRESRRSDVERATLHRP